MNSLRHQVNGRHGEQPMAAWWTANGVRLMIAFVNSQRHQVNDCHGDPFTCGVANKNKIKITRAIVFITSSRQLAVLHWQPLPQAGATALAFARARERNTCEGVLDRGGVS